MLTKHDMFLYSFENYLKVAREYKEGYSAKIGDSESLPNYITATKLNFFRICGEIKKRFGISLDIQEFPIQPIHNIIDRWLIYICELNLSIEKFNIKISLEDPELAALLLRLSEISKNANIKAVNLLRALGVVCESAFIGPESIVVDIFHSCNTNCVHCWLHSPQNSNRDTEYLKGKMGVDAFSKIAQRAKGIGVERLCLLANGEPLMHPEIRGIIEICYANSLKFETVTNGYFLIDSLAEFVLQRGINIITISLPSATVGSYSEICPKSSGEDFMRIKNNIKTLVAKRNKMGKEIEIHITHVIHKINYRDLLKFAEMDIELGVDKVLFKIIQLDNTNYFLRLDEKQIDYLKCNLPIAISLLKESGVEVDELSEMYLSSCEASSGLRTKNFFAGRGCLTGWGFCNIQMHGEVLFCCGDKMVDSLILRDFDSIWFSEKYNSYRKAAKYIMDNQNVEFARGERLLDSKCDSCENVNEHLSILKDIKQCSLECFL